MRHSPWHEAIKSHLPEGYFHQINDFMNEVYSKGVVYPPRDKVFKALQTTEMDQVKVLILGQDPYHGPDQAQGLSFSVPDHVPAPPSLQNIFKEIQADVGHAIPASGSLRRWAAQGVLLLNATLTVRAHAAGSHQGHGWETFTDAVIRRLSAAREHLVFLLWGSYAGRKAELIDASRHLILRSAHPSPLSAYRGFFGNHHFTLCNDYLRTHGLEPINW